MIRMLIADDHEMFRQGLRAKFAESGEFDVLADAGSLVELKWQLRSHEPDVVVLDIRLPDGPGYAVIPELRRTHPACQVVILTMLDHPRYVQYATRSGALGYVVKGDSFEELAKAVREAAAGRSFCSSALQATGAHSPRKLPKKQPMDALSPREFEALTLLSGGASLREAAHTMGVAVNTVATYRTRLMEKLGLKNKTDLVRVALENNLIG